MQSSIINHSPEEYDLRQISKDLETDTKESITYTPDSGVELVARPSYLSGI